ncbi:hypothetical protein A6A25_24175 [Saccharothrix sp. CB00851]|nr:hypothetical protein A6A25_24175 [Saccharothrix sp. CB00851]
MDRGSAPGGQPPVWRRAAVRARPARPGAQRGDLARRDDVLDAVVFVVDQRGAGEVQGAAFTGGATVGVLDGGEVGGAGEPDDPADDSRTAEPQRVAEDDLVRGVAVLPDTAVMTAEIDAHLRWTARHHGTSAADSPQVDVPRYLRALRREHDRGRRAGGRRGQRRLPLWPPFRS